MTTRLLVNPAAGGGRADRLQPWVAAQLQRAFGDVDAVHTTSFQNADEALAEFAATDGEGDRVVAVSYTHLTLPTICLTCRSRWSPYH